MFHPGSDRGHCFRVCDFLVPRMGRRRQVSQDTFVTQHGCLQMLVAFVTLVASWDFDRSSLQARAFLDFDRSSVQARACFICLKRVLLFLSKNSWFFVVPPGRGDRRALSRRPLACLVRHWTGGHSYDFGDALLADARVPRPLGLCCQTLQHGQ